MGQSRSRTGADGKVRHTAYYKDISGHRRSAGTYSSKRDSDRAWQRAETKVAEGRVGTLSRSRQKFRTYVTEEWLPNHVIELTTRENYTYQLHRRVLPTFGDLAMVEILPSHVRSWVVALQKDGVKPPTIKYCMTVLSAIFTTALNDQVTFLHPCMGVRTPPIPTRPRLIISPDQFSTIYAALPGDSLRLLVEVDIETGLRWGELIELRVDDIDWRIRSLVVSRVAVELTGRSSPVERFVVKPYPKDKEWRRVALSDHILTQLRAHTDKINPGELLFPRPIHPEPRRRRPAALPNPAGLGYTEPNSKGRRYHHGTLTAYGLGKCRCQHCRNACAAYRAERRAAGLDHPPPPRQHNAAGHIPRGWFRSQAWLPALATAGLNFNVRFHDLRHAHASWLLAGGADLQVVKERMGHSSITTTEKYLHTLPQADSAAVAAINAMRRRPP